MKYTAYVSRSGNKKTKTKIKPPKNVNYAFYGVRLV